MKDFFSGIWNGIKGAAKSVYNFFRTSSIGKLALVGALGVGAILLGRAAVAGGGFLGTTLGYTAQVAGGAAVAGAVVETGARAVQGVAEHPEEREARIQALEDQRAAEADQVADLDVSESEPLEVEPLQEAEGAPLPRFEDQALGTDGSEQSEQADVGSDASGLGAPLSQDEVEGIDQAFQAQEEAAAANSIGLTDQLERN